MPRPDPATRDAPAEILALEQGDTQLRGLPAPGVYAFGAQRPMGRIRSASSAGLGPFAGRGVQNEFLLLGHVHVDATGKIVRIEGFNGTEGERWAASARDKLTKMNALAEGFSFSAATPLRSCAHTGVR